MIKPKKYPFRYEKMVSGGGLDRVKIRIDASYTRHTRVICKLYAEVFLSKK